MNRLAVKLNILLLGALLWACDAMQKSPPSQGADAGMPADTTSGSAIASREQRRAELLGLLGRLPQNLPPPVAELLSREERDGMVIEKLVLDLNGMEKVPAWFTKPACGEGPYPVVLFNHSHFGQYEVGKNEFLYGRKEMQSPPYAEALARMGVAGLCIDDWGFGERRGPTEAEIFKEMLWKGQVMWGMMVFDHLRALDYLQTRGDVDNRRIGTMGMSMGSTMAWWLAALDKRIGVCVDLCCLTDFETLIEEKGLNLHGIYYYVPDLLTHFSTSDINALISPRPHFGLAGRLDPLTPLRGLEIIDRNLTEVYTRDGAPEAWKLKIYDVGHLENAEMRADILEFFKKWL
jgi:hypothetical protein